MARQLLPQPSMPEPTESEHHAERKVVYETVTTSSTRNTGVTIVIIAVLAIALLAYIIMQIR